jgi:drug/metabolite transporter (DMT)-like permease
MTTHPHHQPHPLAKALPMFLLAGILLSLLDTTAKYLVRDHSLFLVVWARYAGQMAVVTPFARHRAGPGFWRTRHLKMQVLRSLCLVAATCFFFGGLRYLPLAEASAISFLAPVLVVVYAMPILGERPTRARWIAVIIGFVGVVVLLRPGSSVLHPAALLLLGAAATNAMYQVLTRRVGGDSVYTTLFYSGMVGAVLFTLALPWGLDQSTITWQEGGLILLMGLLAGSAHWLITASFLTAPASLLTPFTYVQLLWATLLGYLVFHHLPDGGSALGMAIIVASGVFLAIAERRRARLERSFP